jgi:(p)ppGpp synthase/HD superfamily hydrolase
MAIMTKSRLPTIPPTVERHDTWLKHARQLADLEAALNTTRATIATLEHEHGQLGTTLAEEQIAAVLGDDPTAAARVTAGQRRQADLEQQRTDLRARERIEAAALERLQSRSDTIRAAIIPDLQRDVAATYKQLSELLGAHLAALVPINQQLFALQQQHGQAPSGEGLRGAILFNELLPGPARTKLACWIEHARSLGIPVSF